MRPCQGRNAFALMTWSRRSGWRARRSPITRRRGSGLRRARHGDAPSSPASFSSILSRCPDAGEVFVEPTLRLTLRRRTPSSRFAPTTATPGESDLLAGCCIMLTPSSRCRRVSSSGWHCNWPLVAASRRRNAIEAHSRVTNSPLRVSRVLSRARSCLAGLRGARSPPASGSAGSGCTGRLT